ncbi:MAG: PQQ-binding-like beta-propeller repeat protein [Gemmataceae bacterium]|nr:PQQ-binding-like beta-propeller repeat protein [Gemmataceae bacterium]MDW8243742.1 PQQ-binding-like beta-propeller repeat protein [Thermogemmata sp.]
MPRTLAAVILAGGLYALFMPVSAEMEPIGETIQVAGASARLRQRLAELETRLRQRADATIVDEIVKIIEENGEDLISVDGRRYIPARYWAQALLSRSAPDQLAAYRLRIEPVAAQLLLHWQQKRDETAVRELIDRYALTSAARTALLEYGDWLLERGEAMAAAAVWEHLQPQSTAEWIHSDVQNVPPGQGATLAAAVAARQILSLLLQGEVSQAQQHWQRFDQRYPQIQGRLAGRQGVYSEILAALLRQPPPYPQPALAGRGWHTFGGQPSRNPRLWALPAGMTSRPTWQSELMLTPRILVEGDQSPFHQPWPSAVAAEGRIFLTDGYRLYSFDARTGRPQGVLNVTAPPAEPLSPGSIPCPTLTLTPDGVYLRTGAFPVRPPPGKEERANGGDLVYVRFQRTPVTTWRWHKQWQLAPPAENYFWQGTPLVIDRRLYVAYGRLEGGRIHHGIACYDPADGSTPPPLRWRVDVCSGPHWPTPRLGIRQELLTWANGRLIYNTNNGAIAAVDATTGRRLWTYCYPRLTRSPDEPLALPAPALYDDGRVYAAPRDSDRILALDVLNGRLLWEVHGCQDAYLHAVSAQHLFVTVRRPLAALLAVNVRTGSARPQAGGWFIPAPQPLAGIAQGFLTPESFLYPTRSGLICLVPSGGNPRYYPTLSQLPLAHYLSIDDILIAVTPTHLLGCLPEHLRFPAN